MFIKRYTLIKIIEIVKYQDRRFHNSIISQHFIVSKATKLSIAEQTPELAAPKTEKRPLTIPQEPIALQS